MRAESAIESLSIGKFSINIAGEPDFCGKELPTICLRTSRFFPQPAPVMALYRLYRGVDVRDAARAHILAVTNQHILFDVFNISAHSPFEQSDLPLLLPDAPSVLQRRAAFLPPPFTGREECRPHRRCLGDSVPRTPSPGWRLRLHAMLAY